MNTSRIFLTDNDFEAIFGSDISSIVRTLGEFGNQKCSSCGGKCCREIGCRFYSEKFSFCPIYEIRPRECRYHFCHDVLNSAPLDPNQKELLNKPIKDLLGSQKDKIIELFPLFPNFMVDSEGLTLLGIKQQVDDVLKALEKGELDENETMSLLKAVCLCAGK